MAQAQRAADLFKKPIRRNSRYARPTSFAQRMRNKTLCDPIRGRNAWFAASPPVVYAALPLQRTDYLMRSLRDQLDRRLKLMALRREGVDESFNSPSKNKGLKSATVLVSGSTSGFQ